MCAHCTGSKVDHAFGLELKRVERHQDLMADVDVLKKDVAEIKGDVSVLKGDVAEIKGDVTTLKGDVAGIRDMTQSAIVKMAELERNQFKGFQRMNQGFARMEQLLVQMQSQKK